MSDRNNSILNEKDYPILPDELLELQKETLRLKGIETAWEYCFVHIRNHDNGFYIEIFYYKHYRYFDESKLCMDNFIIDPGKKLDWNSEWLLNVFAFAGDNIEYNISVEDYLKIASKIFPSLNLTEEYDCLGKELYHTYYAALNGINKLLIEKGLWRLLEFLDDYEDVNDEAKDVENILDLPLDILIMTNTPKNRHMLYLGETRKIIKAAYLKYKDFINQRYNKDNFGYFAIKYISDNGIDDMYNINLRDYLWSIMKEEDFNGDPADVAEYCIDEYVYFAKELGLYNTPIAPRLEDLKYFDLYKSGDYRYFYYTRAKYDQRLKNSATDYLYEDERCLIFAPLSEQVIQETLENEDERLLSLIGDEYNKYICLLFKDKKYRMNYILEVIPETRKIRFIFRYGNWWGDVSTDYPTKEQMFILEKYCQKVGLVIDLITLDDMD